MAKGKRLTCPVCKDSSFYTFEQLEALNNTVRCTNHLIPADMIDLVALYEVLTAGHPLDDFQEVELDTVVSAGLIHPDDFEEGYYG